MQKKEEIEESNLNLFDYVLDVIIVVYQIFHFVIIIKSMTFG